MFSFEDDDFPPLPSPALPNHGSVSNNVGNLTPDITKPAQMKKLDVHCRPGTNNIFITVVCVYKVSICYNRRNLGSHNYNFNVNV